jgi:capsular exopolysaccharide synthesis family protein
MRRRSFTANANSRLFCGTNGDRPRVLAVSSANPREGKTTVISNLAIALAEINQRVLLVDGDLRKPRLHHVLDLDNKTGLVDILRMTVPLNGNPVSGLVQETRVPNLWVLPSGPHEFIANLVHSRRFPEFIERARGEFDMILIDTPPMLQISDARIRAFRGAKLLVNQHFLGQATRMSLGPFLLGPGNYTLRLTALDPYGRVRTLPWIVSPGR